MEVGKVGGLGPEILGPGKRAGTRDCPPGPSSLQEPLLAVAVAEFSVTPLKEPPLPLLPLAKPDLSVQSRFLQAWPCPGCAHKGQSINLTAKKRTNKRVSWPKQLLCPVS